MKIRAAVLEELAAALVVQEVEPRAPDGAEASVGGSQVDRLVAKG